MSIKYNQFGEVVSVNGITTGQYLGSPMQDATPKRAEDNEVYAIAKDSVGNTKNVVDDAQPEPSGGDKVLDENGKIKLEQLPDGYPHEETEWKSVDVPSHDGDDANVIQVEDFPAFNVGDVLILKINGVDHRFFAYQGDGMPTIGDSISELMSGDGMYGWGIFTGANGSVFMGSIEPITVSWESTTIVPMDEKFVPSTAMKVYTDAIDIPQSSNVIGTATLTNLYYEDGTKITYATSKKLVDTMNAGFPVYVYWENARRGEIWSVEAGETSDGYKLIATGIICRYYTQRPSVFSQQF